MSSTQSGTLRTRRRLRFILAGVLVLLAILILCTPPGRSLWENPAKSQSAQTITPSKSPRPTGHSTSPHSDASFRTRIWTVPADFTWYLSRLRYKPVTPSGELDPFAPSDEPPHMRMSFSADVQAELGVPFPAGSFAELDRSAGKLEARNTPANLDLIDEIIASIGPMDFWVMDPTLFQYSNDPRINVIDEKLKTIIIPEIDFESITFDEALAFLDQRSREWDPDGSGVRFRIGSPESQQHGQPSAVTATGLGKIPISKLKLRSVPLATVLQYLIGNHGMRYELDGDGVVIEPILYNPDGSPSLLTRRWHVDPALINHLRFPSHGHQLDPGEKDAWFKQRRQMSLAEIIRENGISFTPGTDIRYSENNAELTITHTPGHLDLLHAGLMELAIAESRARCGLDP